ncbi:MAG: ABC transporter permease subunit [Nitrososphaerota archaeon]|nr:ABC transporter permease subunit [Nitrososphaerota archaeon]
MNWLKVISFTSLALLVIPVAVLLYEGFGPLSSSEGYSVEVFRSIALTLISSGIAALVCAVLFTPLSYYFARNRTKVAQTLADIPATIPHPIVGVALLVLSSPLTPFGRFLISIGLNLFNTVLGLVVALVVVSAPIYIKAMQPFFESMNQSNENFAYGLGASKLRAFSLVVIPNSGRGILSASLIAMSRAMSEFGSIAILAYYVLQQPFYGVSSVSVLIFNLYTYSGLAAAVTASAVTILVSFVLLFALRFIESGPKKLFISKRQTS